MHHEIWCINSTWPNTPARGFQLYEVHDMFTCIEFSWYESPDKKAEGVFVGVNDRAAVVQDRVTPGLTASYATSLRHGNV
jgi:hypothetical protein